MIDYPPSFRPIYFIMKDEYGESVGSFLSDGLSSWWSGYIFEDGIFKGRLKE
jgi:hypothetical protein